jgi:hypothetical protein
VGPRAGMDEVAKKIVPCRKSSSGLPARSLVTTLTELTRLSSERGGKSKETSIYALAPHPKVV